MPPARPKPVVRPVDHEAIREMLVVVVNDAVESKLADLKESIHKIMEALTGNGFGANHGLITRVSELERRLEHHTAEFHAFRQEQRDAWARVKWTSAGIGVGAGLGSGGLVFAAIKVLGGG